MNSSVPSSMEYRLASNGEGVVPLGVESVMSTEDQMTGRTMTEDVHFERTKNPRRMSVRVSTNIPAVTAMSSKR